MVRAAIKRTALTIGVLIALLMAAVAYLTTVLDPNSLKPELEAIAARQGVVLKMPGDVSWSFFPQLALTLNDVQVGDEPLAVMETFQAKLSIWPLLKGEIKIHEIRLTGLQLNLIQNAQGQGNWQIFEGTATPSQSEPEVTPAKSEVPLLAIRKIVVVDSRVSFQDMKAGTQISAARLNVEISELNLQGEPFRLVQNAEVSVDQFAPFTAHTTWSLAFDATNQKLHIESLDVQLREQNHLIKLLANGELNLDQLQGHFKVTIPEFDPRPWATWAAIDLLAMSSDSALSLTKMSAEISGAGSNWQIDLTDGRIDQTTFKGHIVAAEEGLDIGLMVDSVVLDGYLPVEEGNVEGGEEASSGKKKVGPDGAGVKPQNEAAAALDFAPLQNLDVEFRMSIKALSYSELPMDNLQVIARVHKGLAELEEFSMNVAGGYMKASGSVDARSATPAVRFKKALDGVELLPLLTHLTDEKRFAGVVNVDASLTSTGTTIDQWQQRAKGQFHLDAAKLEVMEIDLERSACEMAALVNREAIPEIEWKGKTQLQDVVVNGRVEGPALRVSDLKAGVENLAVQGKGSYDYTSGTFEFPLDLLFTGEANTERQCQVRDRWRNRSLPFRCEGSVEQLSPSTCLPDRKRLDDLLRDEVKTKAQEKLQSVLEKKLGEQDGAAVNELLKEILKQRKQ